MSARGSLLGTALSAALAVVLAGSGCAKVFGIDQLSPLSDGGPGEPCDPYSGNQQTPCASGYVCVNAVCQKACNADSQCSTGERCAPVNNGGTGGTGGTVYGCVPAQGEPCAYDGSNGCTNGNCACPGGAVCGPDGQCRLSCNTGGSPSCLPDQTCVAFPNGCGGNPGGGTCPGACYGSAPHDTSADGGPLGDGGNANVVTLQSAQNGPQGIAVSNGTLLWTTTSQVMQCTLPACTDARPLIPGGPAESQPSDIVAVNGIAFWIDLGSALVRACNVGTCSSPQNIAGPAGGSGMGGTLGTDGVNVFFVTQTDVMACPAMLASCTNSQRVFPQMNSIFGMAVQGVGSTVYVSRPGFVGSCSGGGCTMEKTVIQSINNPGVLAIDQNDGLLLAAGNSDQIVSCPIAAGCLNGNVAIDAQVQVGAMLADGPNLYWTIRQGAPAGKVMRCATVSCAATATVLAGGQNQPWALATDSQYLYFTVKGENAVKRVPK